MHISAYLKFFYTFNNCLDYFCLLYYYFQLSTITFLYLNYTRLKLSHIFQVGHHTVHENKCLFLALFQVLFTLLSHCIVCWKLFLIFCSMCLLNLGGVLISMSCGLLCSRSAGLRFTSLMAPRKAAVTVVWETTSRWVVEPWSHTLFLWFSHRTNSMTRPLRTRGLKQMAILTPTLVSPFKV